MEISARTAFAKRLIEIMRERGYRSARHAKSGVAAGPLAQIAGCTREMARRYTEGRAIPDIDRMQRIASWLGVRLPWLRDGEGPRDLAAGKHLVAEPTGNYLHTSSSADLRELVEAWQSLPAERREWFRYMIVLEATIAKHYPWLMPGGRLKKPPKLTYRRAFDQDLVALARQLKR